MSSNLNDLGADLEELLQTALAEQKAKSITPKKATKRPKPPGQTALDSTYKNPDNWAVAANVLLTHEQVAPNGTKVQTDLGMFLEKIHKSDSTARWLVRTTVRDYSLPMRSEVVRGPYPKVHYDPTKRPSDQRQFKFTTVLHAEVTDMELECPKCMLEVLAVTKLGILEARTAERTRFVSPEGDNVLWLPAGMDIYHELSHKSKLDLKALFDEESAEIGTLMELEEEDD